LTTKNTLKSVSRLHDCISSESSLHSKFEVYCEIV